MASREISDLDPALQPLCEQFLAQCQADGINSFITCTYRSNEEQDADYAQGRTATGEIITNAKAGESPHNCTLSDGTPAAKAFDFAIKTATGSLDWSGSDPQWQRAISIGIALGLISGSTFPHGLIDNPHMEMQNWRDTTT